MDDHHLPTACQVEGCGAGLIRASDPVAHPANQHATCVAADHHLHESDGGRWRVVGPV